MIEKTQGWCNLMRKMKIILNKINSNSKNKNSILNIKKIIITVDIEIYL